MSIWWVLKFVNKKSLQPQKQPSIRQDTLSSRTIIRCAFDLLVSCGQGGRWLILYWLVTFVTGSLRGLWNTSLCTKCSSWFWNHLHCLIQVFQQRFFHHHESMKWILVHVFLAWAYYVETISGTSSLCNISVVAISWSTGSKFYIISFWQAHYKLRDWIEMHLVTLIGNCTHQNTLQPSEFIVMCFHIIFWAYAVRFDSCGWHLLSYCHFVVVNSPKYNLV